MKVTEGDHVRGPKDASFSIVEYGDYECPHTRAAEPAVERLLAENPDVRFVFRHFPLAHLHPNAEALAAMAEASEDFWTTHARLMNGDVPDDVPDADDDALDALRERIADGVEEARALGVHSTPTFFFGDTKHDGKYDLDTLRARLEAARK